MYGQDGQFAVAMYVLFCIFIGVAGIVQHQVKGK